MEDAVNGLDVRQEGISKSFSLRGTLDQAGNVGDLEIGWVGRRRLPEVTKKVLHVLGHFQPSIRRILPSISTYISSVGNSTSSLVGLNGAKWVVFGGGALLGQEIEKTRLPHVGQANASHLQVLANPSESNDIVRDGFDLLGRHGDCD